VPVAGMDDREHSHRLFLVRGVGRSALREHLFVASRISMCASAGVQQRHRATRLPPTNSSFSQLFSNQISFRLPDQGFGSGDGSSA
jgi:hypothetical protein